MHHTRNNTHHLFQQRIGFSPFSLCRLFFFLSPFFVSFFLCVLCLTRFRVSILLFWGGPTPFSLLPLFFRLIVLLFKVSAPQIKNKWARGRTKRKVCAVVETSLVLKTTNTYKRAIFCARRSLTRTRDSPSRQSAKAKSGEKETKERERERDLVGLCLARWKLERTRTGKSPSRFIRNIIIVVVNIHR